MNGEGWNDQLWSFVLLLIIFYLLIDSPDPEQIFEDFEPDFEEAEWSLLGDGILKDIQTAVTCYGFLNYSVVDVEQIVLDELETAPYFRLNEMVEELDLKLEKGFVGF